MKPEGREIKRTGYMRGTRMYKARNWFVFSGITFSVALGALFVWWYDEKKDPMRKYFKDQEDWSKQLYQRRLDVQEKRRQEALRKGLIQPDTASQPGSN